MQRFTGFVLVLVLAVYSGFFGAGYGVFLILTLVALHGHTPSTAAALGTRLSLVISTASVAVFIWRGVVPWPMTRRWRWVARWAARWAPRRSAGWATASCA